MEKNQSKTKYWRGLDQLVDPEKYNELAEKEFMRSPLDMADQAGDPVARRDFLKLSGAVLAMGAVSCVRRPQQKIVPYAKAPEDLTTGIPNYYCSSFRDSNGEIYSSILKTREGRPIKMEGNPNFPFNRGALSARAQAHVVSLYDPDRLKAPRMWIQEENDFHKRRWNDLAYSLTDAESEAEDTSKLRPEQRSADGRITDILASGVKAHILTSSIASPSTQRAIDDFLSGVGGKHYQWDPISYEDISKAQELCYGRALIPYYRFDKAKYVVSLGADFLGTFLQPVAFSKDWKKSRTLDDNMSKLVVFEPLLSLTGTNADVRYRVASSDLLNLALGLANELLVKKARGSMAKNSDITAKLAAYGNVAKDLGIPEKDFSEIADSLWENRGQSLVVAGGLQAQGENALSLQIAVNLLNSILENDGKTIDANRPIKGYNSNTEDLKELIADMNAGKVEFLLIDGLNPCYSCPQALGFEKALEKVKTVVYKGLYQDETAKHAHFILPANHQLESWGDLEAREGMYLIQQPTIRPIHDSRSLGFDLINWAYILEKGPSRLQDPESFHDYVKEHWKSTLSKGQVSGSFESYWVQLLQTGFAINNPSSLDAELSSRNFQSSSLESLNNSKNNSQFELVSYSKIAIADGSSNNNPWLFEMPDPVSKIVWDNYITVSLKTANQLSLKDEDLVKLTVNNQELELPVLVQVGQHDKAIGLAVGFGREVGQIARGVGKNSFAILAEKGAQILASGLAAKLEKTGKTYRLANTQGHHYMEGRSIVIETTLDDYKKNPASGIHKHKLKNIWSGHHYPNRKWGMTIDQSACTGCSACVIACQSENNVPVVGKKYVLEGREMHWIRIDRYYSGEVDNPDTFHQPMVCMHCDNAPCETVCPVVATTHSPEGINEMTYNRCVGTRYCANNCPYKVRRFNWFNYTNGDRKLDTPSEAYNPKVTVRFRGVMEKCTFCVQRIKEADQEARTQGVKYKDGDIKTACEQSCPTDAIVFGDVNDPESRVSKMQKEKRAYKLLEEFYAEPAVKYLTKVRNRSYSKLAKKDKGHH